MSKWLVRYNEDEALFKRPFVERIWFGSIFLFVTSLLLVGAADTYKGGAVQKDQLPLYFVMRFDFRQRRYQGKLGFFFLAWARAGDVSEISHIGVWNLTKFTGLTIEWKNTKRPQTSFVRCDTGSEAQVLAERLGINLGVPVKAGIPKYIGKSTR